MTRKIFRSILAVVIPVLLISFLVITCWMYNYFGTIQEEQLRDELNLAAAAVNNIGEDYLQAVSEKSDGDHYRLTWIGADGTVLLDTEADAGEMENHSNREEIQEALIYGTGSSSRHSSTLMEKTLYEAKKLDDGTVLRISVSHAAIAGLVLGLVAPILVIAVLAAVLAAFLAKRMAKRVVEPLNELNLEQPLENDTYEELSPLLHRIHAQHQQISEQLHVLRQKTDEFDQITGSMKEGLVLLDRKGMVLTMNPAAKELFAVGAVSSGMDFMTIDRRHDMNAAIEKAMRTGHSEIRAVRNGREYQFDISRIESDGAAAGAVLLAFDVTEQANAEKNRREFSANVSHELKTPLQSIIGSAELLGSGLVKKEDVPRFIGHIRTEASRLVTLVDDIIRLSQLDEGGEMKKEECSLHSVAAEVISALEPMASEKHVTVSLEGDQGRIHGVSRLFHEILINLCENAIKYNVDGGTVKVTIADREKETVLTVADSGIGIAPEHHSRVFERFYRVDKRHSRQSGGTGLGLSIVKHAVLYHQGKISLQSKEGKGTVVEVVLPRQ